MDLYIYLSIDGSIYLSIDGSIIYIYLSMDLSIYLSMDLSIYLSMYLSIFLSFFLSLYVSMYLSMYLCISLSIYRSMDLSIYRWIYLSIKTICLSVYLSICLSIYLSIDLSIYLCLSVCLSTCLSASLKTKLFWEMSSLSKLTTSKTKQFCETSPMFELNNLKNEAILRDLFIFQSWQHTKRSNSARLPSIFAFDNIKIKAILRDFLQKWKVECSADSLVPMRFAIFPLHLSKVLRLHLSKVLRLPRKIDARSYEVLHLSRKMILANLQIWCSKMQPLSGNQRPDLLTSLMNMSFVLRLPRKMHLCRSSWNVPRLPSFLEMRRNPHVLLAFDRVHNPLRLPRETSSECPKVVRTWCALCILTWKCASRHNGVHLFDISTSKSKVVRHWGALCIFTSKCASRHNGVHFFDISTSKSGPRMVCFVHFDFEMCFAPQRRALFRRLNFQKWSENGVFCTFSLRNVLRATTACTFSTSQNPKLLRDPGVLYLFTWKCASRHNGVQFFISSGQLAPRPPL